MYKEGLREQDLLIPSGEQKIAATLRRATDPCAPVLILLHGFTGFRDELAVNGTDEGVLSRMARLLEEAGYTSLRIDFRGSGESDGAWEDTTFESQIADAVVAVDWGREQKEFRHSKVIVVGWSQGGFIAGSAVVERPDLDGVALLTPIVHPRKTFKHLLGEKIIARACISDPETLVAAEFPWGRKIRIKARFFQDMPEVSPPLEHSKYTGPMLVVAALHDRIIFPQPATSRIWLERHLGEKQLVEIDTDHVFGVGQDTHDFDSKLMPALLGWLSTIT